MGSPSGWTARCGRALPTTPLPEREWSGCETSAPSRSATSQCDPNGIVKASRLASCGRDAGLPQCVVVRLSENVGLGWPGLDQREAPASVSDSAVGQAVPDATSVIVGDPPDVTRQLRELRARIGKFGTLVLVAHDWDDRSRWLRSLELFAKEVRPALAD